MSAINEILNKTSHRPWPLPAGKWQYYQEWNHALFFHWKVPYEILSPLIPGRLELDQFEGSYWVSLVPFTMQKIRPRNIPALAFISDFHEINLRTYIINNHKPGVYFLNIEAGKYLSAWIARTLSGLPYGHSDIYRAAGHYESLNTKKGFHLRSVFEIKSELTKKSSLVLWLTERYCLYMQENKRLFRYDIHHQEWPIKAIEIKELSLNYEVQGLDLGNSTPDLVQYSDGVKVLAWGKKELFT